MNLRKHYELLMAKAKARPAPQGYVETHHILPRSMGGSDDAENLVALTAREHYTAHHLLMRFTGEPGMAHAFWLMTHTRKDRVRITGRQYATAKEAESAAKRGKTPSAETRAKLSAANKGKTLSDEHRAKMSAAKSGENNPNYGKPLSAETRAKLSAANSGKNHPNYGKPLSAEARAKMSAAHKGKTLSDEHRAKLSAAGKGRTFSAEHRAKLSAAARKQWERKRRESEGAQS